MSSTLGGIYWKVVLLGVAELLANKSLTSL